MTFSGIWEALSRGMEESVGGLFVPKGSDSRVMAIGLLFGRGAVEALDGLSESLRELTPPAEIRIDGRFPSLVVAGRNALGSDGRFTSRLVPDDAPIGAFGPMTVADMREFDNGNSRPFIVVTAGSVTFGCVDTAPEPAWEDAGHGGTATVTFGCAELVRMVEDAFDALDAVRPSC